MTASTGAAMRSVSAGAYLIGLAIALFGLANVLPTYGVLPRIGPFPVEWFRPLFYWLCVIVFILADAKKKSDAGRLTILHWVAYAVGTLGITYVCYDYWVIGQVLADSIMFFGPREAALSTLAALLSIWACWVLWGPPIAILGAIAFLYLSTGQYWPGVFQTVPADMNELIAANIWYDSAQGVLGSIMGVVLTTVLPFIILGAILEGCGAGGSMIRISFHLMRKLRGGPAYAAVTASALFGTVSGSAVANVVGTGVVTIPMIKKRGFSPNFAGAVEASASTGGQILPPIMGAAALVMADIVGVSYLAVILAVIVPAIAYYASLFLSIYFEAQKLDISADDDLGMDPPVGQDWLNLLLVFGPIAIIVYLLIGGMSPAGASIAAIFLLIPMSFINPDIRHAPQKLISALSEGGKTVGQLAIAIAIVGIVVSTLSATGIPTKFAVLLSDASNASLLFALLIAAGGCVVLGMGMPTLPAYIAIVAVMGPTLTGFGVELLTAHLFVFMFGVASVITPPVAIAAYAAASISGGKPIGTAVDASRIGAMIFLVPFAFVYQPHLLIGTEAYTEAGFAAFAFSAFCLIGALYLSTSALIGYDGTRMSLVERLVRFAAALALLSGDATASIAALAAGAALIAWSKMKARGAAA
ncbi:MAG: TRAP transporter fused permease subunit [Pseudomonadota bacterium]